MGRKDSNSPAYPGLAILAACLVPFRLALGAVVVDVRSDDDFCFFARLVGGDFVGTGVSSGLGSRSGGVLRLRDLARG